MRPLNAEHSTLRQGHLTWEGKVRSGATRLRLRYKPYRATSPIRNSAPVGPYSGTMPRALWWSRRGPRFLMSEVPLYQLEVNVKNELEVEKRPSFFLANSDP